MSLPSELDQNIVNERKPFPRAYVPLLKTLGKKKLADITAKIVPWKMR